MLKEMSKWIREALERAEGKRKGEKKKGRRKSGGVKRREENER